MKARRGASRLVRRAGSGFAVGVGVLGVGVGVPVDVFLDLQQRALKDLDAAAITAQRAAQVCREYDYGAAFRLPHLLDHIFHTLDKPAAHARDPFVGRILDICIHVAKRDIKHRARVPIPGVPPRIEQCRAGADDAQAPSRWSALPTCTVLCARARSTLRSRT